MPYSLCTAFAESREFVQLQAQYHDGITERSQLAQTSLRRSGSTLHARCQRLPTAPFFSAFLAVAMVQLRWAFGNRPDAVSLARAKPRGRQWGSGESGWQAGGSTS